MLSSGLVTAQNPSQSLIFEAIASGQMPPSRPLSPTDQETLRLWILGINNASTIPSPTPSPSPTPQPSGPQPTFSYIEKNILAVSCVACHSAKNSSKGVALDSYAAVLKTVNKKTPTASLLYQVSQAGSMPPRPRQVLNSEQLQLILTWISQGALNN